MNQTDRENIAWWQKNDRVTLSIAASDPERLEWAKGCNSTVPWQVAGGHAWSKCSDPDWVGHLAYRIDPAYQIPEEPVSPWEEVEVKLGDDGRYMAAVGTGMYLNSAINRPGFGGILWWDDESGDESGDEMWAFLPQGLDRQGYVTEDSNRWTRPCKPVRVRFWRGA